MSNVTKNKDYGKFLFCGLDLHDKSMVGAVSAGPDKEFYVEYSSGDTGVHNFITHLKEEKKKLKCKGVWVAYEASGSGFLLADRLSEEGFQVSVLSPSHLPVSQKSRSNKTDKRDAKRVLDVLRGHALAGGDLPEVNVADPELRDHRELVRRRFQLGEELTRIKNRIHGLLKRHGVRKPSDLNTNWNIAYVAWLKRVADDLGGFSGFHLLSLLREYEFYKDELKEADKLLAGLSQHDRYRFSYDRMISIKGVGMQTAMTFLVELGDPFRFPNRQCLGSYLGLVAKSYESGEDDDRKGHISRMGPHRVRKVLNQAAWSLIRHNDYWYTWFYDRIHNKADKKRMIVALMRKLGIILWHEAKDGVEEFFGTGSYHDSFSDSASRVSVPRSA